MSNLPAPIDPNLLPALHEGFSLPYAQEIFLIELPLRQELTSAAFLASIPNDFALETVLIEGAIHLVTEGGTPIGTICPERSEILIRLMEAGKRISARFQTPAQVRLSLKEL